MTQASPPSLDRGLRMTSPDAKAACALAGDARLAVSRPLEETFLSEIAARPANALSERLVTRRLPLPQLLVSQREDLRESSDDLLVAKNFTGLVHFERGTQDLPDRRDGHRPQRYMSAVPLGTADVAQDRQAGIRGIRTAGLPRYAVRIVARRRCDARCSFLV